MVSEIIFIWSQNVALLAIANCSTLSFTGTPIGVYLSGNYLTLKKNATDFSFLLTLRITETAVRKCTKAGGMETTVLLLMAISLPIRKSGSYAATGAIGKIDIFNASPRWYARAPL